MKADEKKQVRHENNSKLCAKTNCALYIDPNPDPPEAENHKRSITKARKEAKKNFMFSKQSAKSVD